MGAEIDSSIVSQNVSLRLQIELITNKIVRLSESKV